MSRSRWCRRSRTDRRVVEAQKKTGRILQVGSQRVSSIVYQKAKDLLKAGAIGQVNMVEAWWDRNSAIGAWQYSIPPDASPDDDRLGSLPGHRAEAALRADPPVPLAQLSRLRHRCRGRPLRASVLGHALHHGFDWADARVRHRRTPVLEGRPRRSGRHARAVRLSRDRNPSGVQSRAASELRQRRRRELRIPLRRKRRRPLDRQTA